MKESFGEENLQVVDKAREIPGLSGSFTIEINLNCEPPLGDSLVEKDWNQIGNQESDLSQEPGNKSEETLNTQATTQEETATELRGPDDVINTIKLGLNPSPVTPQEKNISGSKKRKKSAEPCSSKKKDKRTPRKPQGGKGSSSEKTPVEWPEPCPNFPFEPLTISQDDDSVIRRYLEQYYTAAGSADGNVHLPDFGLPSFSNIIKVSQNEEPESKKSLDPPCVASSSLPRCVSMVVTMQQTVAGN